MRVQRRVAPLLVLAALVGCGDGAAESRRPPGLGGSASTPSPPPQVPMDRLERTVADRLAARLEREGLRLEYVDCPPWDGTVPLAVFCDGYVDGVVGEVEVRLADGGDGRVEFDAELTTGVVATSRLVRRLEQEGWTGVDCGPRAAHPARPGLRIVCRVHEDGAVHHVVATVTDRYGRVSIEDY
jgi:hypothetical protein